LSPGEGHLPIKRRKMQIVGYGVVADIDDAHDKGSPGLELDGVIAQSQSHSATRYL
jgi:hypothetical protein